MVFGIDQAVAQVEATGGFRVLRRVDHGDLEGVTASGALRTGVAVDTETTGIEFAGDRIIEFAARMFRATCDGRIVTIGPLRSWLEDPGELLTPEISRLTGIFDFDLRSCRIDDAAVAEMLSGADFVVAHNAEFDRPFVERRFPDHCGLAWCCSCRDVDWSGHGFQGRGLGWLLAQCGLFHSGHRAGADVDAVIALLRYMLPNGRSVLAEMLETAEKPGWIVSALGAHFDVKDGLRARGYRWDADGAVWRREVSGADLAAEREWLDENVYRPEFRPRLMAPSIAEVSRLSEVC